MHQASFILDQLGDTGLHQQDISALFDGKMAWKGPPGTIQKPLIVIAFTNRCGSNYLAELMRSTGLIAGLGEALNSDTVANRAETWGLTEFPQYFQSLANRHKIPFGVKASWDQLLMLLKCGIHEMHTDLRVVHIHRRDIVGQAISRHIAWQTGKWTSQTRVEEEIEPEYDEQKISHQIESIVRCEMFFSMIFKALNLAVCEVSYEELVAEPDATLHRVMKEIGYPSAERRGQDTKLKKQAGTINESFRTRYLADVRARCLA